MGNKNRGLEAVTAFSGAVLRTDTSYGGGLFDRSAAGLSEVDL